MKLLDLFTLDHFLFSFHPEEFAPLPALCDIFHNCEHKITTRPDMTYEGVYLIARDGNYLELLKYDESTPNIFGSAFSSLKPNEGDADQLPTVFSDLHWVTAKIFDNNQVPWYSYYGQMHPAEAIGEKVIFWAMQYHNFDRHRPYTFKKVPPKGLFSVREFLSVHGKIPLDRFELVKEHSQWVPGSKTIDTHQITFLLPNASQNRFELKLDFDEAIPDGQPISITMKLLDNIQIDSQDLRTVEIIQKKEILTMTFRE